MTMKEFKTYLDNLITMKENFILENKKLLMNTYYGKLSTINEYLRQMLILNEYKDLRKVINN